MIRICSIVGARPQFVKASAISRAIQEHFAQNITEFLIHTGQHYDYMMSEVFFKELGIPEPALHGEAGAGSQAEQTANMLLFCEKAFMELKPDLVLVYGDTNSTLAGALAASKLGIHVAHIEAGLRSYDRAMPEEINRVLTDHLSSLLYVPVQNAIDCLKKEGIQSDNHIKRPDSRNPQVYNSGDVMLDTCVYYSHFPSKVLEENGIAENEYLLCTIHRPSNADKPLRLERIFNELLLLSADLNKTIILPLHPRTKKMLGEARMQEFEKTTLRIIEPQGYLNMLHLERNAFMIITDSGGVQKEAYFFKKPCVIVRDRSEWTEILQSGWAVLAGDEELQIRSKALNLLDNLPSIYPELFGDAKAANHILEHILNSFNS